MLDKSLPYFNIIMKRRAGTAIPVAKLPAGYYFTGFSQGDENDWAEILTSVGEFDNEQEAVTEFRNEYMSCPDELSHRLIFVCGPDGKKAATAICWWNYTGARRDPSLHWIAARPEYQGLGLGKAVVFEAVRRTVELDGDTDFPLHTQTWSYKAVGIYLEAGYRFVRNGAFADYVNENHKALPILVEKTGRYLDLMELYCD